MISFLIACNPASLGHSVRCFLPRPARDLGTVRFRPAEERSAEPRPPDRAGAQDPALRGLRGVARTQSPGRAPHRTGASAAPPRECAPLGRVWRRVARRWHLGGEAPFLRRLTVAHLEEQVPAPPGHPSGPTGGQGSRGWRWVPGSALVSSPASRDGDARELLRGPGAPSASRPRP